VLITIDESGTGHSSSYFSDIKTELRYPPQEISILHWVVPFIPKNYLSTSGANATTMTLMTRKLGLRSELRDCKLTKRLERPHRHPPSLLVQIRICSPISNLKCTTTIRSNRRQCEILGSVYWKSCLGSQGNLAGQPDSGRPGCSSTIEELTCPDYPPGKNLLLGTGGLPAG